MDMIYHDFIIKITDKVAILSWLASKGIDVNRDENGVILTKTEKVIGSVCTPKLKDINSDKYIRIRFKENIAAKIPDKPLYIMWRSDVENPGDEPMYEVQTFDMDGNLNGTRMQRVGTF